MKTILLSALLTVIFVYNSYSSPNSFTDNKYIITYKFTETSSAGTTSKEFKLYRDGSKIKFVKKAKNDKGDEIITSTYAMLDEKICYEVVAGKNVKTGTKHNGIECSYIGMNWGVYISDLDNWQTECNLFTAPVRNESVAGKDCTVHEVTYRGVTVDLTTYWFYDNKIILKKQNTSITMEAVNIDENPTFAVDEFVVPADVQWY